MKCLITLACICVFSIAGLAQKGTIRGVVVDAETGEGLIGAPIFNQDRSTYTRADFDGSYTLKLNPGEQYIKCQFPGYEDDSVLVKLEAGATITVDIRMVEKSLGPGIVIKAKAITGGVVDVLKDEREEGGTTSGLSKDDMRNQDVSNAATAAGKIGGVSVQGGKYVFVRGLSDRYSKTTVNGAEVPGLDPNRNSVQMDLFPANLIDKLTVYKSFTPDLPGSFTGGLVNIETRDFPESFIVGASIKFGFNTQSSFNNDFLTQTTTSSTDFLGFDNGTRGIPSQVQSYTTDDFNNLYLTDNAKLDELGKSFSRDFDPIRKLSSMNSSYSFSIGNQIDPANENKQYPKIGYVVGVSYRKNFNYYDNGFQGRYNLVGSVNTDDALNAELELDDTQASEDVLWGTLGNVTVKTNSYNSIGIMGARFQNGISSTRYLEGNNFNDANDLFFQTRTLMYQQRALTTGQLKGEHVLGKKDTVDLASNTHNMRMDWVASYTMSQQETPELKFFTNDYTVSGTDTSYDLQAALYSDPSQFYRYMEETNLDLKVNFEKPFDTYKDSTGKGLGGKFKFGGSYVDKERVFSEKRYDFVMQSGSDMQYEGSIAEYMADDKFRAGDFTNGFIYTQDATEKRNSYVGSETNIAAYAMADFYAAEKLRLVVGARAESDTIYSRSLSPTLADSVGGFNKLDILPSLNGTYLMKGDTLQLRFAYTRTLARPTFRELAPFSSFDFVGGNVFVGNRSLRRTAVDNLDLRLEYYPTAIQKISFGVFAKQFTDPIERAFNPEAANAELTWRNVDNAIAYGAELDFRFKLDSLSDGLKGFTVGGNLTYVYSEVKIPAKEYVVILAQDPNAPDTRQMFGQAPYIINGFVSYSNDSLGLLANLNFGVSGDKLSVVTVGGTPNVFENARPNLGFNIAKKLGAFDQFQVKLTAQNLLNPDFKQYYEYNGQEYLFGSYKKGRYFTLALRYTFDKAEVDAKKAKMAVK